MDKLKNGKKSISSIALAYMIAAAVVSAAVIMCSYCMIHYLNIARESSSLINKFEETYKFMESKESATSDDIEDDLCMSARLAASAVRAADDDLRPAKYRSGYIIRKRGGDVEFPEDYSSDITLTLSDLPQDYSTNVIDNNVVSCAKIRGNYYYVELQEKSEEEKVIKKGVKYQDALDNIASATGFDYISVQDAENGDYTLEANSPCRDRGLTLDWMTNGSADLLGNPRLVDTRGVAFSPAALPDLGCYEIQERKPSGFTLFVR